MKFRSRFNLAAMNLTKKYSRTRRGVNRLVGFSFCFTLAVGLTGLTGGAHAQTSPMPENVFATSNTPALNTATTWVDPAALPQFTKRVDMNVSDTSPMAAQFRVPMRAANPNAYTVRYHGSLAEHYFDRSAQSRMLNPTGERRFSIVGPGVRAYTSQPEYFTINRSGEFAINEPAWQDGRSRMMIPANTVFSLIPGDGIANGSADQMTGMNLSHIREADQQAGNGTQSRNQVFLEPITNVIDGRRDAGLISSAMGNTFEAVSPSADANESRFIKPSYLPPDTPDADLLAFEQQWLEQRQARMAEAQTIIHDDFVRELIAFDPANQ